MKINLNVAYSEKQNYSKCKKNYNNQIAFGTTSTKIIENSEKTTADIVNNVKNTAANLKTRVPKTVYAYDPEIKTIRVINIESTASEIIKYAVENYVKVVKKAVENAKKFQFKGL